MLLISNRNYWAISGMAELDDAALMGGLVHGRKQWPFACLLVSWIPHDLQADQVVFLPDACPGKITVAYRNGRLNTPNRLATICGRLRNVAREVCR